LNHAMKHAKHEPCSAQNNMPAKLDGGSLMWPGEQSLKQCGPLLFPIYYFHPDILIPSPVLAKLGPNNPQIGPSFTKNPNVLRESLENRGMNKQLIT
jgi:hypothetical protein